MRLTDQIWDIKVTDKILRNFGLLLAAVLLALAGISWWKGGQIYFVLLPAASLSMLAAVAKPGSLRFVYIPWMTVAQGIGWVMARVILSTLYFVVFTPVSFVLKIMGRDLLDESIERERETYWIKRDKGSIQQIDFERQF